MDNHLRLIAQLRKSFKQDTVCLFYSGKFDDFFTDKMINLIGFESKGRIRGNLAFVIAESFQNVVRHKNPFLRNGNENVFGIRGRNDYMCVFSSNLVSDNTKAELTERLDHINGCTPEELRDAYMTILREGELSEKGGARMGLIEMARRSGHEIQYEFMKVDTGINAFNMQVDFNRIRGEVTDDIVPIEDNSILNDIILDNEIQFIYKGYFNADVLDPMMPIIENCTKTDDISHNTLLKVANGLVQNIEQYGMPDGRGRKRGLFALKKLPDGFYMCSGNYTLEDTEHLQHIVDSMNSASPAELDSLQMKVNVEKARNKETSARVGILDIRRSSGHPIDLKLSQDAKGNYAMLGVKITPESLNI